MPHLRNLKLQKPTLWPQCYSFGFLARLLLQYLLYPTSSTTLISCVLSLLVSSRLYILRYQAPAHRESRYKHSFASTLKISLSTPVYCVGPKNLQHKSIQPLVCQVLQKKITQPYKLMRFQNLWHPISAETLTLLSNVSPVISSLGPLSDYSKYIFSSIGLN